MEDADSPTPRPLVHAIAVHLPPNDGALPEAAITGSSDQADDLREGRNSALSAGWLPPDPPPGHGVHRYLFQIFALEAGPAFGDDPGRDAAIGAIQAHGLASGCLIGTYERRDGSIATPVGEEGVSVPTLSQSSAA